MSFDVMVFEQKAAPRHKVEFVGWATRQMEWSEGHGYENPEVATPRLRAWLFDIARTYPGFGDNLPDDDDDPHVTDYSIGREMIYAGFNWSVAESALASAHELARRHKVGLYEVSSDDGTVWVTRRRQFVEMD